MSNPITGGDQRTAKDALALSPIFAKAGAALATYEMGNQLLSRARGWYNKRTTYKVGVDEFDPVFDDVHDWLMSLIPDREHKEVKVITGERREYGSGLASSPDSSEYDPDPKQPPLRVIIDDDATHTFSIGGYRVKVSVSKPDVAESGRRSEFHKPQTVIFECRSLEAQKAVIAEIESLRKPVTTRIPTLNMVTQWGSWRRRSDVPKRSWDSVFLPPEQKERIRSDVERFLSEEEHYNRLGIPYHRGYLLHGHPGSGKTSLAKALATHFNRDLWYVPLADLESESGLMNLISDVRPGSFLLLEDIDSLKIATTRGDQGSPGPGLTTGSLLNALDGVATPHGLISILTTNHFDVLDPALTRAGRMDLIEEITYGGPSVIAEMFEYFYGVPMVTAIPDHFTMISQAEVAEVFKRHMGNPERAEKALHVRFRLAVRDEVDMT